MTVINTNTAATITANALTKNERAMSQAMERLSTGVRINSAGDDAAGLAISSRMTSQINGLNQAVRNANDAISMIQTADGAMVEITNMLQRMRELSIQATSGTMSSTDVTALGVEFEALENQIQDISANTEWNGTKILNGELGAITFQIGANASQTIGIEFADLNTDFAGNTGTATTAGAGTNAAGALDIFVELEAAAAGANSGTANTTNEDKDLESATVNGSTVLTRLDNALNRLNAHRSTLGATINRLEYAADNLANVSQNTSASRSRILDADYASETTELARTQIIQQAGTAMLSQANQQAQSVLALLK
jgi:flagellin|tara:strand:+ start:133 stop:1068 length:936 start_codon:yes stop_codon:yes gene_type:complete